MNGSSISGWVRRRILLADRAVVVVEDQRWRILIQRRYVKRSDAQPVVKPELVSTCVQVNAVFREGLGWIRIPIIPHETATFLDFIVGVSNQKYFRIGTAVGFSSKFDGNSFTTSKNATTIDRYGWCIAVPKLALKTVGRPCTQLEGDAADVLPTLEQGKYDFYLWIAPKPNTSKFFPYCMDVLEVVAC